MDAETFSIKLRTVVEILIVPIMAFGVYLLKDITSNIQLLNTNVAIILEKNKDTSKLLEDHELRLRVLELKGK